MTLLSEYMALKNFTDEDVAAAIDLSRVSVLRYRRGEQHPNIKHAVSIEKWSNGAVPLKSWPKFALLLRLAEAAE